MSNHTACITGAGGVAGGALGGAVIGGAIEVRDTPENFGAQALHATAGLSVL